MKFGQDLRGWQIERTADLTVHVDTCGPMRTASINKHLYFVIGVEEFSNYRFVKPIHTKDQAANAVKAIINQIHQETGKQVVSVVSDQGTEFVNANLRGWLAERGISHCCSASRTPEQNGTAESAIRAVVEGTRTQMVRADLPTYLWSEIVESTVYVLNRCQSPRDANKTRFELYFGHKPDASNLRVIGQQAIVKKPDHELSKWGAKGKQVTFINYTPKRNTFRFYDAETRTISASCDVRSLPLSVDRPTEEQSGFKYVNIYSNDVTTEPTDEDEHWYETISTEEPSTIIEEVSSDNESDLITLGESLDTSNSSNRAQTSSAKHVTFRETPDLQHFYVEHRAPDINEAIHNEIRQLSGSPANATRSKTRSVPSGAPIFRSLPYSGKALYSVEEERPGTVLLALNGEPDSYQAALASADSAEWREAIQNELSSLHENRTWSIVDKPPNCKLLKTRWIFKTKLGSDGQIDKYKARLVAKGYSQIEGVDFHQTFSPVASLMLVRLLISTACSRKMDVKTAFLYGHLDEEIYLAPPEGLVVPKGSLSPTEKSLRITPRPSPVEYRVSQNGCAPEGSRDLIQL